MMLAAAHLSAALTIPAAVAVAVSIVWYGQALADAEVPESRRRIRRACGALMFIELGLLVAALSFADASIAPMFYVVTWLLVLFTLVLLVVVAGVDVVNTLHLERRMHRRRVARAAAILADIVRSAHGERVEGKQ